MVCGESNLHRAVVWVSAALMTFGITIMCAVADDRQICDRSQGEEAIAACSRLINLNPDDAHAYTGRGNAYLAKADYDRAIAEFDQAIKLNPKSAVAYRNRATTYESKGDSAAPSPTRTNR
jgi:tetratricopeptide (TPR) repeat protein